MKQGKNLSKEPTRGSGMCLRPENGPTLKQMGELLNPPSSVTGYGLPHRDVFPFQAFSGQAAATGQRQFSQKDNPVFAGTSLLAHRSQYVYESRSNAAFGAMALAVWNQP